MRVAEKKRNPKIISSVILFLVAIIQLFPLYWLVTFSLKSNAEIFGGNILGLPQEWQWDNYVKLFQQTKIPMNLLNSAIITALTIGFTLILSAMITYALVRLKWRLSKMVYILFLIGMMIPIHAILLPLFINLKPLMQTHFVLVLPYTAFAMPISILIMTGFLEGLQKEIEEAAFIDGASVYKIFLRIILPVMSPTLATVAILTFLSSWNEMMLAVSLTADENLKTITTGVIELVGRYSTKWGRIGAGLTVATIPTVIIYIFLSEKVQKSLTMGAVKG